MGHGPATRYSDCAANRSAANGAPPRHPALPRNEAYFKISPRPRAGKRSLPVGAGPALGALVAGAVVAWSAWQAGRHLERVEVAGLSMAPCLQPGDHILVWRTRSVRPGDIVAAADPRQPARSLLKRVIAVGRDGVVLIGDNPEHSTDSRQFGPSRWRTCKEERYTGTRRQLEPGNCPRWAVPTPSGTAPAFRPSPPP